MPPGLGNVERHDYEVRHAYTDLLEASRTEILLARLEGVDEGDFEILVRLVAQPNAAHSTSTMTTTNAAMISA